MNAIEYHRIPRRELRKWSNIRLRINFRDLEDMLINCQKRKDILGKNAQTVYKKYKERIIELEDNTREAENKIGELNDRILDLEDSLK